MTRVLQLVRSKVSPRGCRNVDEKQERKKMGRRLPSLGGSDTALYGCASNDSQNERAD